MITHQINTIDVDSERVSQNTLPIPHQQTHFLKGSQMGVSKQSSSPRFSNVAQTKDMSKKQMLKKQIQDLMGEVEKESQLQKSTSSYT